MRYFLGKNGRIYKDYQLAAALYICAGRNIATKDIVVEENGDAEFIGIDKEIFNPTVEDFLRAGQKMDAVALYRDTYNANNPNADKMSVREALNHVDRMIASIGSLHEISFDDAIDALTKVDNNVTIYAVINHKHRNRFDNLKSIHIDGMKKHVMSITCKEISGDIREYMDDIRQYSRGFYIERS